MLHTSDLHIAGDAFTMGRLRSVVDTAIDSESDIVLVAGDLFDSSRVRDDVVESTLTELRRFGRPLVIIPGNHDCMDEGSIYHRMDLTVAGEHVYFAGERAGQELFFEDLSLVVWARGIESHDPSNRPLAGYVPSAPQHWRVVMTHGHYVAGGEPSDRSSQIGQEEIGRLRCDYVALGHWHRFTDVSEGGVKAYYSGSPSEPGADGATVNLVTLDSGSGVSVERRAIELAGGVLPPAR